MRKTRLFINTGNDLDDYKEVDLYDEIDIPVTYNVADVQDISKKDSNFSLTVEVPNTNNNAVLFDLVHDIARYNSTFELLKQYPAFVEVDGNRTFEGYLRLTKVIISDLREISYECNLYSNFIEFVKRLGTTTLRGNDDVADDLSFSEYAIQLTESEWFNRTDMYYWDTTPNPWVPTGEKPYGKDFYFAPIDKFNFGSNRNSVSVGGEKFVPMFFDEFTPFLFIREIWDKIFKWVGFSYVSDFIQDTANNTTGFEFEKLVYPATSAQVGTLNNYYSIVNQSTSPSVITSTEYQWHRIDDPNTGQVANPVLVGTQQVYYNNYSQPLSLSENPAGSTQFGIYNTQCWQYTAPTAGHYSFDAKIRWNFDVLTTDVNGNSWQSYLAGQMFCNTNAFWRVALSLVWHDTANNVDTTIATVDSGNQTYEATYNFSGGVINLLSNQLLEYYGDVYLQAGDTLRIDGWVLLTETTGSSVYVMKFADNTGRGQWGRISFLPIEQGADTLTVRLVDENYIGATFDPTVILNPKRKKADFVNDIIKKFNLYVEDVTNAKDANGVYYRDYPNGDNKRTGEPILRIEPRDMYYSNNPIVKDWTEKTDVTTMNFKRIDDYLYNVLTFNDKDDKTFHVEDYNNYNYVEGEYGEKIITSPYNTDSEQKTEIKTDLGQTMCGRVATIDIPYNTGRNTYIQCPFIFTLNNDGSLKEDKDYNDRMLFVTDLYWNDYADIFNASELKGWRIYGRDNAHPGQFTPTYANPTKVYTYLLVDHFNAPFGSDTADLNYDWANWYLQNLNGTWATPDNAYKVFYADMVSDYNNPDSRLLACNMYLSPSDIRDLQLSDTILVNGMAYHLNKIEQWTDGNSPVKVELIKILQSNSSVPGAKGKKGEKEKTEKTNNPPAISSLTTLSVKNELDGLGDEVQGLTKMVKENESELSGNKEAIKNIQEVLKKLDERIKKLEKT